MQRPQGISAHEADAPGEPDVGLRLSVALKRLAALRATIHGDWSEGPAALLDVANIETASTDGLMFAVDAACAIAPAFHGKSPTVDEAVVPDDPIPLRGRFADTADALPAIVAFAFTEDCEARATRPAMNESAEDWALPVADGQTPAPVEADIIEIDYIEPAFSVGATAGLGALFVTGEAETQSSSVRHSPAAADADDLDPLTLLAFGAAPDVFALTAIAEEVTSSALTTAIVAVEADAPELAVGAFALWFDLAPDAPAHVQTPVTVAEESAPEIEVAFGAAPLLMALLDITPATDVAPPDVRAFDPMSLVDDALADAFDALLRAPDPIDPYETAWTADAMADTTHAAHLAACEAHLWALPRHLPCVETFLLTPNHETAVRITRALRVRANALEARAFAETATFGFLRTDNDAQAFWFLADALHDAASLSAGDADVDASFSDWRMSDDGLLVVTAPDNAHPKRPPPLISEAELDALFAHVDDAQSRVVLDDLGDDPTWNDTFWCDVDTYLEQVSETMDPSMIEEPGVGPDAFDIHDIEVRSAPVAMPPTTFFWMPGDDFDLAVDGDGGDLFIVGANETPAVVLIEDGSAYAMRTGQSARMDEVVVSLSFDEWRYIEGMHWRRVATLSGIAQVRVEQNVAHTRRAVIAGAFFATTLEDDGVRLVLSGDDGDVDYPVTRIGGPSGEADWPFTADGADADTYVVS